MNWNYVSYRHTFLLKGPLDGSQFTLIWTNQFGGGASNDTPTWYGIKSYCTTLGLNIDGIDTIIEIVNTAIYISVDKEKNKVWFVFHFLYIIFLFVQQKCQKIVRISTISFVHWKHGWAIPQDDRMVHQIWGDKNN